MCFELLRAATNSPLSTYGIQPGASAFSEHGSLEFCKRTDDLHHHPTARRSGIDSFGQTTEVSSRLRDLIHQGQHILEGSREAI